MTFSKLGWLEQVSFDPDLSHFAVRVATVLAVRWLNQKTGEAWPAQETLAQATGATADGVRKAVLQLEAGGHMTIKRGAGRGQSSRYRPVIKPAKSRVNPRRPSGLSAPKPQTAVWPLGSNTAPETPDGGLLTRIIHAAPENGLADVA